MKERDIIKEIQELINSHSDHSGATKVLEVGCGSCSHFEFPVGSALSGIDISQEQLERNTRLQRKILGDVQTFRMPEKHDIVICWNVLEHIQKPEKALANILEWTDRGGIIIITVPNVLSLKGIATKLTPLWFHRWAYRNVLGFKDEPFPTFMRYSIAPHRLLSFFGEQSVEYINYARFSLRKPLGYAFDFALWTLRTLSFNAYKPELSQFYLVVRKNA